MNYDLFKPKYTKEQKEKYYNRRLNAKRNELEKQGIEGKELGFELKLFGDMLKTQINADVIIEKIELTPQRKRQIREHIVKANKTLGVNKNASYSLPSYIRTHQEFINHITKKEGMFSLIFPALKKIEEGKQSKCVFYSQNNAWIYQTKDGIYRYYTRREGGRTVSFSIVDMMEMNLGKGVGFISGLNYARREIARVLGVNYYGLEFEAETTNKYLNNIERIELEADLKRDYPNLYKLVGKQLYILLKLHTIALTSVIDKKTAIKKEAVFFASTRMLAQQFGRFSEKNPSEVVHSPFAKAINLFATLELLTKHNPKEVDTNSELYNMALQIRNENDHFNMINFLSVPFYDDKILAKAEKTAKRLVKAKITNMDKITKQSLLTAFGEKKANEVYGQTEVSIYKLTPEQLYQMSLKYCFYPDDIE